MSISADDLPREGFNTQNFIDNMAECVGSKNILDVIMSNPMRIARQLGAKPPAYHPSQNGMYMINANKTPAAPIPQSPQESNVREIPSKPVDVPDTPKGLHTPKANMMPGADTKPGMPLSENDMLAFKNAVAERNAKRVMDVQHTGGYAWGELPSQFRNIPPNPIAQQNRMPSKPIFFKDGLGNEYKTVDDKLYVLGWQDSNVKIRLVNETTGKEVPTNGKKFQIFGWHLVKRISESESTCGDDITQMEREISTDDIVKKEIPQKITKTDVENTEVKNDKSDNDMTSCISTKADSDNEQTASIQDKTNDSAEIQPNEDDVNTVDAISHSECKPKFKKNKKRLI